MASCSIFLSNAAYLDIVIVDNTQEFSVIRVTFSLSSFLMLLITFLIQNGALMQSADSLSPARPSSHSSLEQDPSLPPPSRPFLPDLLSMGLALMRAAEIMSAIRITLEEIILCLCVIFKSEINKFFNCSIRPHENICSRCDRLGKWLILFKIIAHIVTFAVNSLMTNIELRRVRTPAPGLLVVMR